MSRHEGQADLLELVSGGIATALKLFHIGILCGAKFLQILWLTEVEEVWPQATNGVLCNVGDELTRGSAKGKDGHKHVDDLHPRWNLPAEK